VAVVAGNMTVEETEEIEEIAGIEATTGTTGTRKTSIMTGTEIDIEMARRGVQLMVPLHPPEIVTVPSCQMR
jgi:phenylacetate-coenzyme A ligase PaaK-like adenylate-forming protein